MPVFGISFLDTSMSKSRALIQCDVTILQAKMAQTEKFLLLEDRDGTTFDPSLTESNIKAKDVTLLRGDLLVRDQSQHAFLSYSRGDLILCPMEILARLTDRQFALLLSLQSSSDRLDAYHNSLFEAEDLFTVNSKVYVQMKDNRELPGIIWYEGVVGKLGHGIMFGVELLVRSGDHFFVFFRMSRCCRPSLLKAMWMDRSMAFSTSLVQLTAESLSHLTNCACAVTSLSLLRKQWKRAEHRLNGCRKRMKNKSSIKCKQGQNLESRKKKKQKQRLERE